jgi:hypothetical protein
VAVADYYGRAELAASQVLSGFSPESFREKLESVVVRVSCDEAAATAREGRALVDLLVRLLARLYPTLQINSEDKHLTQVLEQLARDINPVIDLGSKADVTHEIVVGGATSHATHWVTYGGSNAWRGVLASGEAQRVGDSANPLGAGLTAAFACAALFRAIFLDDFGSGAPDLSIDAWDLVSGAGETGAELANIRLEKTLLVGCGAIGNAALWALRRAPVRGVLHVVDPERLELSNLQRYVLATRDDVDRFKVDVVQESSGHLEVVLHPMSLAQFLGKSGYEWESMLLALDSARDRRSAQLALPRRIFNSWTQLGDLGVSAHDFLEGACVGCLYLPAGARPNQDQLVADALGVRDRVAQVRDLLYRSEPVPDEILQLVSERLSIDPDLLVRFRGKAILDLYVEGICGGALVRLGTRTPGQAVQVPLAHQSALAGVLLAAAALAQSIAPSTGTWATRVDVMRPVQGIVPQPLQKDPRGICICQDDDFVRRYRDKWMIDPRIIAH